MEEKSFIPMDEFAILLVFWKLVKNKEDFHWDSGGQECKGLKKSTKQNLNTDKILNSHHRQKHEMKHYTLKSSLIILVELTKMNFK